MVFRLARIMGGDADRAGVRPASAGPLGLGTGGDRVGARHSRTCPALCAAARSDGGMAARLDGGSRLGRARPPVSRGNRRASGAAVAADTGERSARPGLAGPARTCWMARQRGSELEPPVPTAWYRRADRTPGIAGLGRVEIRGRHHRHPALSRVRDCLHARRTHQQFLLGRGGRASHFCRSCLSSDGRGVPASSGAGR